MPLTPLTRAFILGAGLGTRLRPLTQNLPKPLVPIRGEPLVVHALRHLRRLAIQDVIINTHHAAHRWQETIPKGTFEGIRLTFRHEPILLDTGGGLKNVEDFLAGHGTFVIYNGDILTDLPLEQAVAHHQKSGNLATLILRSSGGPLHISLGSDGQILDIRNTLGCATGSGFLFTGIHIVEPEIFRYIPNVQIQSIISIYLDLLRKNLPLGGIVVDAGHWSDVGTPEEYARVK